MRISDGIAYVDDDGFETPVQVRECVVIGNSHVFGNGSQPIPSKEADNQLKNTAGSVKTDARRAQRLYKSANCRNGRRQCSQHCSRI